MDTILRARGLIAVCGGYSGADTRRNVTAWQGEIRTPPDKRVTGPRIDSKPTPSYVSTVRKTPDAALHKSQ
jgi:hypothetical protein